MAALFCTTLAPLAGRFGFFVGVLAGAVHLPMVMHVGSLHGFMNLYNNGFAGGLVMLIIVGFLLAIKSDILLETQESKMIDVLYDGLTKKMSQRKEITPAPLQENEIIQKD